MIPKELFHSQPALAIISIFLGLQIFIVIDMNRDVRRAFQLYIQLKILPPIKNRLGKPSIAAMHFRQLITTKDEQG